MSKTTEFSATPELLKQLYEYSIIKNYEAGDVILDENARIRSIPIVTKGSIKVMRTEENGREILLYYIKAGESCVMSFLGGLHGETSKVKAEGEEDAEIVFFQKIVRGLLLNSEKCLNIAPENDKQSLFGLYEYGTRSEEKTRGKLREYVRSACRSVQ